MAEIVGSDVEFGSIVAVQTRRSERIVSTIGIVFLGVFGLLSTPIALVRQPDSIENSIGVCLFVPVVLWFVGAIRAANTVLYEGGVVVQNWFTRYWIPWSAVAAVEVEPGVSVQLTDGNSVQMAVGGGSLLNQWRGNRYQHSVRERIEELWQQADDASTGDASEVKREWILGVKRLTVWLAVFLASLGLTLGGMELKL